MKHLSRLFLAFVLIANGPAWAAVAIVGTPTVIDAGGTYTAETGSNRVVVACLANRTLNTGGNENPSVSAMSIGGDSLANAQLIQAVYTSAGSGANWGAGCWYVKEANIDGGSMTVSVTWNFTMQSTTKIAMYTLSGVDQTTSIDTTVTKAQGAATSWQQAITVANNSVNVSASVSGGGGISSTPDAGWTEVLDATGGGNVRAYSQYRAHVTGASVTWGQTVSTSTSGRIAIASFAEAAASAPTFSVAPAIGTRTTSSIPVTATTACTDCTFYGVAAPDGASTPTCDQIEAQTVTSAYKYFSQAMTGGVQGTGTFSTYTDGTVRDGFFCLESTANGDSSVASIADMYKIPAFSAGPTFSSCTATGCSYSLTLDGAGTVYGVACKAGVTAATVTQVEAGNCTGDAAAVAAANKAVTGADTLTVGSALDYPKHDFAIVGVYGSQHEAAIHADNARFKSAVSNHSYDELASVSVTSWCNGISAPAVAASDVVEITDPTAILSQDVTLFGNCNWSFSNSGARDRICARVYDDSVRDWMSISSPSASCSGTRAAIWFNNQAPVFNPATEDHAFSTGEAFSLDICALATDAEGDTLTLAVQSGTPPTGLSLGGTGNCTLSGTVANGNEDEDGATVVFRATDIAGDTADYTADLFPLNTITVPTCIDVAAEEFQADLDEKFVPWEVTETAFSDTIVAGNIIACSPSAGNEVDPFTDTVEITLSLGRAASRGRKTSMGYGMGVH